MSNVTKAFSELFDTDLRTTDTSIDQLKIQAVQSDTETLEKQRDFVRKNMIELIEQGKGVLTHMKDIAVSTESNKDFDTYAKILKTLVDSNAKLLEMEITGKPQQSEKPAGSVTEPNQKAEQITNNTVFVGSTTELAAYMKNKQQ
jgi:PBP1b-binding outer membrane lipoprotein LpoB